MLCLWLTPCWKWLIQPLSTAGKSYSWAESWSPHTRHPMLPACEYHESSCTGDGQKLKVPELYYGSVDHQEDDTSLIQKRSDIIHSAAAAPLEKYNLVRYERASGRSHSTNLGLLVSYYYVTYSSMATTNTCGRACRGSNCFALKQV